jgi:hypothetical protein
VILRCRGEIGECRRATPTVCKTLTWDEVVVAATGKCGPRGLPAIDDLAIQALVAAFASNKTIVDESSARAGVAEATTE